MLKANAVAQLSNMNVVWTLYGPHGNAVDLNVTGLRERSEVVSCKRCGSPMRLSARLWYGVHWDLTASIPRLYGASSVLIMSDIYLAALLMRCNCHGVDCAVLKLLSRSCCV